MSKLQNINIDEIIEKNPSVDKKDFHENIKNLEANKEIKTRRTYYDISPPFSKTQIKNG